MTIRWNGQAIEARTEAEMMKVIDRIRETTIERRFAEDAMQMAIRRAERARAN